MKTGILFLFLLLQVPAFSNAVSSQYDTGGIVFKKNNFISIEKEDLRLSIREIRVSYDFFSKAERNQNLELSFPMPVIEANGDYTLTEAQVQPNLIKPQNYVHFQVKVNGRKVKSHLQNKAFLKGKDVTVLLKRRNLSFVPKYENLQKLPLNLKKELESEGLLEQDGTEFSPRWKYQVVAKWKQSFPPGKTVVDIRYVPVSGTALLPDIRSGSGEGEEIRPEIREKYCLDKKINSLLDSGKYDSYGESYGYVLKTALYWNGPIKDFRLRVEKNDPADLVIFCPLEAKKISDRKFEWRAKNFIPEKDIYVMQFHRLGRN